MSEDEKRKVRKQSEMVAEALEQRLKLLDRAQEILAKTIKTEADYRVREVQARVDMLDEQADQLIAWMRELKDLEEQPLPPPGAKEGVEARSHNFWDRKRIMEIFRIREKKWKATDRRFKQEIGA